MDDLGYFLTPGALANRVREVYPSQSPSDCAVANARSFLTLLKEEGVPPTRLAPSAVGGVALTGAQLDAHPRLAGDRSGGLELRVDVLARADRPLHVLGRLATLLGQTRFRDRLIRAHQLEFGADRARQIDRLAHSLSGCVRAVGAYDDRSEHAAIITTRGPPQAADGSARRPSTAAVRIPRAALRRAS